jgi:hypothetical protein
VRDLAVIVPSRGRPQNITRLYNTMMATAGGDTQLIVGLDGDDEGNYPRIHGVEYVVSTTLRHVGPWINHLATEAAENYRFVGHIGDDNVISTPLWDMKIMEALGETRFAFGNDKYPREPGSLCCHLFTWSDTIEKLGYLAVPALKHMWVDPVWMAWGRACGITYLPDVEIPHLHFTGGGNAPYDDTYARSVGTAAEDKAAFDAYCAGQLNTDIGKLGGVPYTPDTWAAFKESLHIR